MPTSETPDNVLEIAIGRMMRHSPAVRLRALCASVGFELDIAEAWALLQIYRYAQVFGVARLGDTPTLGACRRRCSSRPSIG